MERTRPLPSPMQRYRNKHTGTFGTCEPINAHKMSWDLVIALFFVATMVQITDGRIACVTGASGYLGIEVTAQLLEAGFIVRGTVRNPDNPEKTLDLRSLKHAERLTLLKADLLGGVDAFLPCVEGAQVLVHTASPFITQNISDPMKQLVLPAVSGTVAAVSAALKSPSIKSIILTSSIAATMSSTSDKGGRCFHEHDWNTKSKAANGGLDAYRFSKTMAEKKFWELLEDKTTNPRSVAGVSILPSFIVGPSRTTRTDGESGTFMKMALTNEIPYRGDTPMCDVRDVATAHVRALGIAGRYSLRQRFIISSKMAVKREEVLRWLREVYPNYKVRSDAVSTAEKDSGEIFCPHNLGMIGMLELRKPRDSIIEMAAEMIRRRSVTPIAAAPADL